MISSSLVYALDVGKNLKSWYLRSQYFQNFAKIKLKKKKQDSICTICLLSVTVQHY